MKVTSETRYEDFAAFEPLLAKGEAERIEAAAIAEAFGDGFMGMKVGELLACQKGDLSPLLKGGGQTVFDVYRARGFKKFMDRLIAMLKAATMPATAEDMAARSGVLKTTFEESVYTFCRQYFNLASFAAVDDLTVAAYVLAKRDDFNRATVDRNMAAAIRKGAKK